MKQKFIDAQRMAKKNPNTFFAPTPLQLSWLCVGDLVKVCYEGERFWCKVIWIEGDNIMAIVDNNTEITECQFGSVIHFEKRHIYDIDNLPPLKLKI